MRFSRLQGRNLGAGSTGGRRLGLGPAEKKLVDGVQGRAKSPLVSMNSSWGCRGSLKALLTGGAAAKRLRVIERRHVLMAQRRLNAGDAPRPEGMQRETRSGFPLPRLRVLHAHLARSAKAKTKIHGAPLFCTTESFEAISECGVRRRLCREEMRVLRDKERDLLVSGQMRRVIQQMRSSLTHRGMNFLDDGLVERFHRRLQNVIPPCILQ